jgi:hypothetical protein
MPVGIRDLGQGRIQDGDVVGGGVGPGPALMALCEIPQFG